MNRRSFFSFLSAAPVGVPIALLAAAASQARGLIRIGSIEDIDSTLVRFRATPGEVVNLKPRLSPTQMQELFHAINDGLKDGHRLCDPRGKA